MFGFSFLALLPVRAANVFAGGPKVLGYLVSAAGLGACLGALVISAKSKNKLPFGFFVVGGAVLTGIALVLLSFIPHLWIGLGLLFFAGFGFTLSFATLRAESQILSDKKMRGRVAGFTIMAFFFGLAVGNYLIGFLAEKFSIPIALQFNGIVLIVISVITYLVLNKIEKEPDFEKVELYLS